MNAAIEPTATDSATFAEFQLVELEERLEMAMMTVEPTWCCKCLFQGPYCE
jgi:hypothetical protein